MQLFPALPEVVQGTFRPAPFGRLERRGGGPCERGIFIVDHTTNYQLSQWETTDRILMEDFNSDNAKIDAALAAHDAALAGKADAADLAALTQALAALEAKSTLQVIKTVTQAADGTTFQIDLSDVDWSQWSTVYICLDLLGGGYYYSAYGNQYQNYESHAIPGHHCLVLWPMHQPEGNIGGVFVGYNTPLLIGPGISYSQFTSYKAVCSDSGYTIKKGSKITVKGLR